MITVRSVRQRVTVYATVPNRLLAMGLLTVLGTFVLWGA